jgi:hypothetical protein
MGRGQGAHRRISTRREPKKHAYATDWQPREREVREMAAGKLNRYRTAGRDGEMSGYFDDRAVLQAVR